jgi:hypothetical protein
MLLPDEPFVIMEFITNNVFTSIDPSLRTAVATRKANLLLSRHLATNNNLPNSSIIQGLLLNSSSTGATTSKHLPSLITVRDLAGGPLLLLQHLSNSVMVLPIATTSDTRTAPAGEKLSLSESTTSTSVDSSAAVSTMSAT